MLRLFSRPRRQALPVRPRRARLTVEPLESRSGPSALYDPLVVEPLDTSTALWSTADATAETGGGYVAGANDWETSWTTTDPAAWSTSETSPTPSSSPSSQDGDGGMQTADAGGGGSSNPLDLITSSSPTGGQGTSTGLAGSVKNAPPEIVDFAGTEGPGRCWTFTGRVIDEMPAGLTITFGGQVASLAGKTTTTDAGGGFSICVVLQAGEGGTVTAVTVDDAGQASNVAQDYVHQTQP